jgi:outer membrane protein assembly factor BamB
MKGAIIKRFNSLKGRLLSSRGNVLVYIVLTMVIFGILGVTMVSLFSTSITASATQNDTRRATYLSEAGVRYAMSEMLSGKFSKDVIDDLNTIEYSFSASDKFKINVFSPWFEPESILLLENAFSEQNVNFDIVEGRLPAGLTDKLTGGTDLYLVNYDFFDRYATYNNNPPPSSRAIVTGGAQVGADLSKLQLSIQDDSDGFVANRNEIAAFAVQPFADLNDAPLPVNLLLQPVAAKIFPLRNGSIEIRKQNYFYDQAIDRTTHVELTNVRPVKDDDNLLDDPTTINVSTATDYVILNPRNRYVISEGHSGDVYFGNHMNYASAVSNILALPPLSRKPDIEFEEEADLPSVLSQVKQGTNLDFIAVDNTEKLLTIGGGTGPSLGAVWFRDTRSIGGVREFCNSNGCFFEDGIRVFFLLEYTGSGDGFIFSLINGSGTKDGNLLNDTASIGGDIERSEMLGYSGDSRLDVAGTQFLDTSGVFRGLLPPKIGVEFDTKVNVSSGDNLCSNSTNLRANTRNDPGTPAAENRDAVQFVYWAASTLDVPCREEPFCQSNPSCTGDPSYDDNRHNALFPNWEFNTGGAILSAPAIGSDGTIYVGSNSTRFYAVNPDGTEKWQVNRSGAWYSPTLTSTGRIYVGTGATENRLFAIRDDGTFGNILWSFPTFGPVTTKPAVGTVGASDGIVYFGSDDGTFRAVNSSGTLVWAFTPLGLPAQPFRSSPAISQGGGTVYFGSNNGNFYARNAGTGAIVWTPTVAGAGAYLSSPVVGPSGTVYVGNDNGRVYAFNGSTGTEIWNFDTGAPVRSSPALSSDGTRVYIGSENNILFALNAASGAEIWRFTGASGDIDSGIQIDANGHIYFGSDDDNVYALYPDGTLKWSFTTGGNVEVRPAVKGDGTVYAGSSDGHLYSINQVTTPANLKNLLITSSGQSVGGVPVTLTSEADWLKGSSSKGPWAVRLEIARSQTESAGTYAYNLKAWIRQCNAVSCNDPNDPLGTFYEDTRTQYSPAARPPMIEQTVNLVPSDHNAFERFIFGFTSQTGAGETQTATIRKFQLSFVRTNDPVVETDPLWP